MMLQNLAKVLMAMGALIFVIGVVMFIGSRLGLGNMPGDITWRRGNTSVYFPVVTMIVVSLVLTVVLNLLLRFFSR